MNDPSLREEGLSMIPLGHPTHLEAKAKGESSMLQNPFVRVAGYSALPQE
jgi:hypothetical protein